MLSSREIFPTQGLNPGLLRCRPILYPLSHQGKPNFDPTGIDTCMKLAWVTYRHKH